MNLSKKYDVKDKSKLENTLNKIKNKECYLFAMSGKMASGKDTIGDLLSKKIGESMIVKNVSFGYLIKKEIDDIVNYYKIAESKEDLENKWDANLQDIEELVVILGGYSAFYRSEAARSAAQFWGTEVRRKQNNNYWLNLMVEHIIDKVSNRISINVTDARFPNEIELIEDLGGKVVRLEVSKETQKERISKRDGIKVSDLVLNHYSEVALDNYVFDFSVNGEDDVDKVVEESFEYLTNSDI